MPNWIGDFLLALSVVEEKVRLEKSGCMMLVPDHLENLCRLVSSLSFVTYRRSNVFGFLRTVSTVRRQRFETAYILPHSFSSAIFAFACGIPRRRGVRREQRQVLLTDILPRSTRNSKEHITREYATVLEIAPPDFLQWKGRHIETDERGRNAVVMCPGASYGTSKKWPYFPALAKELPKEKIVLLGTGSEKQAADEVAAVAPERIRNLAGATSIVEAARIIAAAKLVIANDSGLMHVAGYLGTPVVGIFGSTRPSWTTPLGAHTHIAYRQASCSPCFERTCRFGHYECLTKISAREVLALAERALGTQKAELSSGEN